MASSTATAAAAAPIVLSELNIIESAWYSLTQNFSEFTLATWITFCLLIVVYIAASLPYWIIDYFGWFRRWKIQKRKIVSQARTWECVKVLIRNHIFIALPLTLVSYPVLKWRGITSELPFPSWTEMLLRVIFYFMVEDLWFYWGHRFLHTEWGYRKIHHIHHEFDHPIGMASSYAHPLEFVFLGVGTFLGPMILGPGHLFSIWVWMVFRQFEAIECHCGYDFPWHLHNWVPFYAGPFHHDYHHYTQANNYASVFTWWDRIFGTDAKYRAWCLAGGHAEMDLKRGLTAAKKATAATPAPVANGNGHAKSA